MKITKVQVDELPESCENCLLWYANGINGFGVCFAIKKEMGEVDLYHHRPDWCPLVSTDQGMGWKPYPENKPEENNIEYNVELESGIVTTDYWDSTCWWKYHKHSKDPVVRFRPLPAPYQPKESE